MSGLYYETAALRAALRIGTLLNRTVVLPGFCTFSESSGLVPPPALAYRDAKGEIRHDVMDDGVDGDWCTAGEPRGRGRLVGRAFRCHVRSGCRR